MAVDIAGIISNALGGAESAFARKEQRMNLADQRRRRTVKEQNNRLINSGVITLDEQRNLSINLDKVEENRDLILEMVQRGAPQGASYKDADGNKLTGIFKTLPKVIAAEDGTKNYVLEIETADGEIKPVTVDRSTNLNDPPALVDPSSYELMLEGAFLNQLGEFGIDGTAVAVLENLNYNTPTAKAQAVTAGALNDTNIDPATLSKLISELGMVKKETNPSSGKDFIDKTEEVPRDASKDMFGSPPSTVTGNKEDDTPTVTLPARTTIDEAMTKELSDKYKIGPDAIKALMDIKPRGPRAVVDRSSPVKTDPIDLVTPEMLFDSGYLDKEKDSPNDPFKIAAGKRQFVRDFYKDSEQETLKPPEVELEIPDIPTDVDGATAWFSDKANTDIIDQLDQDKVSEIRNLLESQNINSKEELVDAVRQGMVTSNQARSIAKITAWSVVDKNGQKDAQLSANLYAGMMNDLQTGNPDVTPTELANAETARNKLALDVRKFGNTLTTQKRDEYNSLLELYETAGDKGFDSAEFLQQLKPRTTLFLRDRNFDELDQTDKALMDGVLSQALLESARQYGPEGFMDRIGDIFLRSEAGDTLGNTMDNVAIEYDKPGPDGKPVRLIFTRTRGSGQVEAEESLTWNNVTEIVGEGQLANYLLSRAKRRD